MNTKVHINYTIVSLMLLILGYSCENADLNKPVVSDSQKITERYVDDCEDCPNMDDCCCEVTWVSGNQIEFEICGTTDGDAAACSDDIDPCSTIDGLKNSAESFSSTSDRMLFCMVEGQSFTIKALNTLGATLNVGCQYGQLNAQSINVVFNGPGTKAISVNGTCEVEQCYP
jgi:hypothetical protein